MTELALLAESHVITDQTRVTCLDFECVALADVGGDVALKVRQHVKRTGHTVRLWREYSEEIRPNVPEPKSAIAELAEAARAERDERRAARKQGGRRRG